MYKYLEAEVEKREIWYRRKSKENNIIYRELLFCRSTNEEHMCPQVSYTKWETMSYSKRHSYYKNFPSDFSSFKLSTYPILCLSYFSLLTYLLLCLSFFHTLLPRPVVDRRNFHYTPVSSQFPLRHAYPSSEEVCPYFSLTKMTRVCELGKPIVMRIWSKMPYPIQARTVMIKNWKDSSRTFVFLKAATILDVIKQIRSFVEKKGKRWH